MKISLRSRVKYKNCGRVREAIEAVYDLNVSSYNKNKSSSVCLLIVCKSLATACVALNVVMHISNNPISASVLKLFTTIKSREYDREHVSSIMGF
jgi:hypothetical protein